MDSYDEKRLRDEVIYLHSLWRKGPPGRNANPRSPQPNPVQLLHQPLNPPIFKNKKKKIEFKDPIPESSDLQWQTQKTPKEETLTLPSGWPALKSPQSKTRQVSADDKAKWIPTQMQQKGLEAARVFFDKKSGSDCEEDDDDDEMDEDDDGCDECEEHTFFMKLFTEDGDLRSYYEKNSENGDFYCLVCNGIGKKVWKRYKNCVAIVQHSIAISKTAKRRAHRAYGQVICKVLGWDMNRLPTVVLSLDSTLSQSLAKTDNSQIDPTDNADGNELNSNNKIDFNPQNKVPIPESADLPWQIKKRAEEQTESLPSGWPALKVPQPKTKQVSPEDQTKLIPTQLQQLKGLEAARVYFEQKSGSDCGEEEDDDGCEEWEEHTFFMKLFTEDGELRSYYEKNSDSGDFYCLVCNGIGKKVWKKYKNCIAVVQHSIAISKTAKRRAHRAYGQVICKVLGWDINRLPTDVLSLDSTLSQSLTKTDNLQVDTNENTDGVTNKLDNKEEDANVCSNIGLPECSTSSLYVDISESIAAETETAPKGGETNTHLEESGEGVPVSAANVEELKNSSIFTFLQEVLKKCDPTDGQIEVTMKTETIDPDQDGDNRS